MPTSREILVASYRLGRMKKVTFVVHASQAVLTLVMLILVSILTPDFSLFPLHLPFAVYVLVIGVMLVIVDGEGFFFRSFGIKWAKTDSERFLMAQDNIKRGLVVIIVAVVIIALINGLYPVMEENVDTTKEETVHGVFVPEFFSQDAFGITGITSITLSSDDGVPLDVYILLKEDYNKGDFGKRLNPYPGDSEGITNLSYKRDTYLPFGEYVLYISAGGATANVTYTMGRDVSQNIIFYLTIFPGVFAMMNACWVIYLLPLKKRYEKTSIYE
ncbi:MAG: hypothetical protein JSW28_04530 [Thermoplasmata archaeon]|nr:MAG: hypothetical protein JSW28_04530 [Thermoplasmata archaeon]